MKTALIITGVILLIIAIISIIAGHKLAKIEGGVYDLETRGVVIILSGIISLIFGLCI